GLKCALMVAEGEEPKSILAGLPVEVTWRTGQFGMLASTAAYREGDDWLDGARTSITSNFDLLDELLREHLPDVSWRRPGAGYLAWLDFRGRGWGDDPAARILGQARVALSPGTGFGSGGCGWARINVACSPELLTEAVRRIAALPAGPQRQRTEG